MRIWLLSVFCFLITSGVRAETVRLDPDLELELLSPGIYLQHSWMEVEGFGRVGCNGLVYLSGGEGLVIDSPGSDRLAELLLGWIEERGFKVKGLVVGHTHDDSLGGLAVFTRRGIPSFSSERCQSLARQQHKSVPEVGFEHRLTLRIGQGTVICSYPGEGHAPDNSVTYLVESGVLFGGCLLKAVGASPGNLEDANVTAWPQTVERVDKEFPDARVVVPGHGEVGGREILDYTRRLILKQ